MDRRVSVRWTPVAAAALRTLPPKVRRGLLEKADELYDCDPKSANKPLVGPLVGHYAMKYSRFRAIYRVDEETIANGDVWVKVDVCFVAAGIRKERDKKDVYELAEKLVSLGILDPRIVQPPRT